MQPEQQQGNWSFKNEDNAPTQPEVQPSQQPTQADQSVTWTGSEFISHHKDSGWYLTVIGALIMFCTVIFLVTKDIISVVAITIVTILFLVASARKPEQRTYTVDPQGFSIDSRFYPYSEFKSFSLHQEGVIGSVTFMPLKRFMPDISLYFAPEDSDQIINILSASLPNDQRPEQSVDRLMKRLRF